MNDVNKAMLDWGRPRGTSASTIRGNRLLCCLVSVEALVIIFATLVNVYFRIVFYLEIVSIW